MINRFSFVQVASETLQGAQTYGLSDSAIPKGLVQNQNYKNVDPVSDLKNNKTYKNDNRSCENSDQSVKNHSTQVECQSDKITRDFSRELDTDFFAGSSQESQDAMVD